MPSCVGSKWLLMLPIEVRRTCRVLCDGREGFLTSLTKTLQKHVPVGATSRDTQDNLEYSMKRVGVKFFAVNLCTVLILQPMLCTSVKYVVGSRPLWLCLEMWQNIQIYKYIAGSYSMHYCVLKWTLSAAYWWFAAQRCYVHKTCFRENRQNIQRSYVPLCGHMTFVLLIAACAVTCHCQNHNILQWCKRNKHFRLITVNKYSTLPVIKYSNIGLGINSTAGLKIFVEEWNGHNVFVHRLKFDELLQ